MITNSLCTQETTYSQRACVSKEELRGRLDRLGKEINAYKNAPWYGDSEASLQDMARLKEEFDYLNDIQWQFIISEGREAVCEEETQKENVYE